MEEHTESCASRKFVHSGDARNPHVNPDYAAMRECDYDGYHTFDELYDHRISLYIALCRVLRTDADHRGVWRSKRHSDGEICFGTGTQFVLGISHEAGKQITYHIPIERWNETEFAETLEKAPEWDSHSSKDVLERLKNL